MAEEWIKFRKKLLKEPEVREMAVRLKVTRQHVCGCLLGVWSLADEHAVERLDPVLYPDTYRDKCPADDGTNSGTDVEVMEGFLAWSTLADVDHEAEQAGFGQAMVDVGWLRVYENGLGFPSFQIHHSKSAKKRSSEQKRKARQRSAKGKSPADVPGYVPPDVPMRVGHCPGPEGDKKEKENKKEIQKGGGGRGERKPAAPATTTAEEKISGEKNQEAKIQEAKAQAERFLAEWDGIEGVSHAHMTISDERMICQPAVWALLTARMRDPAFLADWEKGLRFVRTSDLCRGRIPPKPGFDSPWRADVKWFCSPGNLAEILEGKKGGNSEGLTLDEEDQEWARNQEVDGQGEADCGESQESETREEVLEP